MRKTLTLILAVALFGILAAAVVAQVGEEPTPSRAAATTETTESAPDATTPDVTTPDVTTPDVTTPERTTTTEDNPERVGTERSPGVDISGPCDEAEHAGDPRCNGAVASDDNSGPGSVDSGHDDTDDVDGDHGGSSGSGSSGSSSSGSGHGGDDDSSGHGGGDDD